jgi:hypothetical protein
MPAVTVLPLLPPQPTSMTLRRGARVSARARRRTSPRVRGSGKKSAPAARRICCPPRLAPRAPRPSRRRARCGTHPSLGTLRLVRNSYDVLIGVTTHSSAAAPPAAAPPATGRFSTLVLA